jgi:hypothetical protein
MGTSLRLLLGVLLVLGLAAPAAADHDGPHPTFRAEPVWFVCAEGDHMKVQNLEFPVRYEPEAPDRSVQDGAGCGQVEPGALVNTQPSGGPANFSTVGDFQGNLQNITVELYILGGTQYSRLFEEIDLRLWVEIDGIVVVPRFTRLQDVPLEETGSGATQRLRFTLIGLQGLFGHEDGDGTRIRDISVTVGNWFTDEVGNWVWGTTEVPAGLIFNDPTPASYTVTPS